MVSVLIVDSDEKARTELTRYLRGRGCRAESLRDASAVLPFLLHQKCDVVLLDADMPGVDVRKLVREIVQHDPQTMVALSGSHPTVADAVRLVREGADDYLAKPLAVREMEHMLKRLADIRSSRRSEDRAFPSDAEPTVVSASPAMARAVSTVRQIASSDMPVLFTGEVGAGKGLLASAIHRWSPRRTAPFATVWCAALGAHPIGNGLLDHLHGAFAYTRSPRPGRAEPLDGGTIFFDEIGNGNLPLSLQVKLLNHLENQRFGESVHGELNCRVVAASSRDLEADVRKGLLREDLYLRLNVVTITVPPLRGRTEDLPALCEEFLGQLAVRHHHTPIRLTPEAEDVLAGHRWPGNVRELINVLERAVVLSRGEWIGAEDLSASLRGPVICERPREPAPSGLRPPSLDEVEQTQIQLALEESATLGEAAARLGIDPATLWRKRKRYGFDRPGSPGRSASKRS